MDATVDHGRELRETTSKRASIDGARDKNNTAFDGETFTSRDKIDGTVVSEIFRQRRSIDPILAVNCTAIDSGISFPAQLSVRYAFRICTGSEKAAERTAMRAD